MVCPHVCSPEMEKSGRGRRSGVGMEGSWGELQVGFRGGGESRSFLPHQPKLGPLGTSFATPPPSGSSRWLVQLIGSAGGLLLPF